MTFEEMTAQRDPLYAATRPGAAFRTLYALDGLAAMADTDAWRNLWQERRDMMARDIQAYAARRLHPQEVPTP